MLVGSSYEHPNRIPCFDHQCFSLKPGIRVYLSMQTLPGAAISINWPLVLKRYNGSGNFFPQQNFISITKPWFSRISSTAMLFVCGIKLADKLPKSFCAGPNFPKLWRRRCIAAFRKSYLRKMVVLNVTLKSLYWALKRAIMGQV